MKEYRKSDPEPSFMKPTRKSDPDEGYPGTGNPDEEKTMPNRSSPITN